MHSRDFSYLHYAETLKRLKANHDFSNYLNYSANDVILRHDIDFSLEAALSMAKIEKRLGISSTYFILFHSDFYNPFSIKSSRIIKKIVRLGHYLGLHYDSSFIIENGLNPTQTLKEEINLMEHHFSTKITAVAIHNPTTSKKIKIRLPHRIANADSCKFKRERRYVSDSVQNWREGCFCSHVKCNTLHILIHPIWWTSTNMKRKDILKNLVGKFSPIQSDLKEISKLHTDYLSKIHR